MKAVIQRVSGAEVDIDGSLVSSIGTGLLVLLGIEKGDRETDAAAIARKITRLRIFDDPSSKMNLSVLDISGEILVVSQFTLAADCGRGNRPSFVNAEEPENAQRLYQKVVEALRQEGVRTGTGQFAARMQVHLVNSGPVTILLDSKEIMPSRDAR